MLAHEELIKDPSLRGVQTGIKCAKVGYKLRCVKLKIVSTKKSYWRGRLRTVDLLVVTSLYKFLLIVKILFTFYKTRYLNVEVNCTEPSLFVSFLWFLNSGFHVA